MTTPETTPATRQQSGRRGPIWLGLFVVLWLAAAGGGLRWLLAYQGAPRPLSPARADWPAGSGLRPAVGRPTLLMFAHPHCSCTLSGLKELAWLGRGAGGALDMTVLFVRPVGAPPGWERTGNWGRAAALPGVAVRVDEGGEEARRFGATTSGEVLVYDGGRLVFQGGLKGGGRHHEGHAAARALLGQLRSGGAAVSRPSYGCPLVGPAAGDEGSDLRGQR